MRLNCIMIRNGTHQHIRFQAQATTIFIWVGPPNPPPPPKPVRSRCHSTMGPTYTLIDTCFHNFCRPFESISFSSLLSFFSFLIQRDKVGDFNIYLRMTFIIYFYLSLMYMYSKIFLYL